MKKKLFAAVSVILSVTLTACAPGAAPSGTSPSPSPNTSHSEQEIIEISVVTSYGGDDGNRQNYENAYRAYEGATGNVVKDDSGVSSEEWKTQVMAGFDSGNEPDILFYFTGVDSNRIVSEGKVVSIEEIRSVYPDYASNMKDSMLAKSPVDGKCYSVPVNGYWEGLFVNKKVLADCGVPVPDANTTWEQFLADCQTIADKGYIPIAASLYELPHYWFEFCVFNNGSIDIHPVLPAVSSDNAGKNWAAGLYDIKDLYERGFFPENTTSITGVEADALMTTDKAAFMIEGSWKLGWFAENAADINDFTVTYVPGKGERKSTDIIGGLSMGYYITKKAWDNPEKQAACVAFVQAMTTDEVVETFGATAVTALVNGIEPPQNASSFILDALEMTKNCTGITVAVEDGLLPNARADLFANIRNIVTGEITAEAAIDQCLTFDS